MNGHSNVAPDRETVNIDSFPKSLATGSTVLIASAGDPSHYAIGLRALCQFAGVDDAALVVTTTESADQTIEKYLDCCPAAARFSLGLVDTTSEHQSVSSIYGEIPIVFTPAPGDLERLVLALAELSGNTQTSKRTHHLLVRSLTPILETSSTSRVSRVLERITGFRSETGLCLFGLDYTAHDEETMAAVTELVDGVLWVTQPSPDRLELEYQLARGHPTYSVTGGETDG